MRIKKIEFELLDFIRGHEYVNFEDIEKFFERKGIRYKGDTGIYLTESRLVVWNGWNRKASLAFMDLVAGKKLELLHVDMSKAPMPPAFRDIKLLNLMEYVPVLVRAVRR